jgi:predicted nucleic acid-binding protein
MDRLLFDTNVILDVLDRRAPHLADALQCLATARAGKVQGAVTALTLSDASYVCRKRDFQQILAAFAAMRKYLSVAPISEQEVEKAIARRLPDFEDGLQWEAARAWGASHLVTRNVDDFPKTKALSVLTPAEYLRKVR